jgi:PAS domain S-box-containing protein
MVECLLLAQSGHADCRTECPLLGVKRTSLSIAECPLLTQSEHPSDRPCLDDNLGPGDVHFPIKLCSLPLEFAVTLEDFSALALGLDEAQDGNDFARLLAALVSASREFIGIADREGNALFVNQAGRDLVGLPDLEAVRATRVIEYFACEDRPKVIGEVLPAVRTTGFWQGELTFRNFATGQLVPVLYNIFPIRNSLGEIIAYGTVTRNLTEARLTEQRLRSLASIVESSDDAIVSKDIDGVITSWNNGAEGVFGYSAEEAVGQPITLVIPSDRYDEEREILTRIRRGERIDHFETIRQPRTAA